MRPPGPCLRGILALALFVPPAAFAADLSVEVDNLKRSDGWIEAIVRVNNGGSAAFSTVYVDCAFLDATGRALDTGMASISNLTAGATAFGSAEIEDDPAIASAACRIAETY